MIGCCEKHSTISGKIIIKKSKKVAKYFANMENCSTFALAFRAMAR
jgi:hypothetical protein